MTFVTSFWKPDGNGKKTAPAGFSAGAVVRSVCSRDFAISRVTVSDTETALCAVGSYRKVCFIACIFSLF